MGKNLSHLTLLLQVSRTLVVELLVGLLLLLDGLGDLDVPLGDGVGAAGCQKSNCHLLKVYTYADLAIALVVSWA